ncbi:single-stranded DNA-binding protein [Ruminococcus sp.]|uniref:single-stranded DNA-binding protein n=1 Tax=Ruminococcus sp. TaxID=41978 RepID=UPI001B73CE79|nr:single-stranded DNA-binding protein [Ruminococcus sp.]MBP5431013.1 single-stranded DNA-binding protein [Ruminococcus sp.]
MYSKLQDGSFVIAGFVAKDAKMNSSQGGKTYTKWSVKVGTKPSQNQGERGEAIWTNCIAWHDLGRLAGQIKKGDTVLAIGKIETNDYEGKTYKTLNCEYISIMGKAAGGSTPAAAPQATTANNDLLAEYEEILGGDDMPF